MYVAGNLCLGNNAGTAISALIVGGQSRPLEQHERRCEHEHEHPGRDVRGRQLQIRRRRLGRLHAATRTHATSTASSPTDDDRRQPHAARDRRAPRLISPSGTRTRFPGRRSPARRRVGTPPTFDTNYPIRDNNVGIVDLTPDQLVRLPRRPRRVDDPLGRDQREPRRRSAWRRPPAFRSAHSGSGSTTS